MQESAPLKEAMEHLRALLSEERNHFTDIEKLLNRQIEREAGIWEYDFDALQKEMWQRFAQLEDNQDCLSEDETLPSGRFSSACVRRLKKLYRTLSGPLSRSIIDKRKQFNLDQQALLNRESVPFYLALILTLQKMKDRLNGLEESVDRVVKEQEEQFKELKQLDRSGSQRPGS